MQYTTFLNNWVQLRISFFNKIRSAGVIQKIGFALIWALITGILAQVKIPLPWTPVPITGQTFAILLSGVILGSFWGGLSQFLYVGIGLFGIPWFTGMKGGSAAFFGPTGGYLIGFILAAVFIGYISDKYSKSRNFLPMMLLMIFANFILIYIPGLVQLGIFMKAVKGSFPSVMDLLMMGLIPFILGDILKISFTSITVKIIAPKKDFLKK